MTGFAGNMNWSKEIWEPATSGADVIRNHVEALTSLLAGLDPKAVEQAGEVLDEACLRDNTIYCAGNGGSAATASHIATDLFWGRRLQGEARPRAVSLVSNTPLVTALGNDVGYDRVFTEQLNGVFKKGDVLVGVSASGNSQNVLLAADFANSEGGTSVGLVGFDGGELADRCHVTIHIPTPKGAYELVEDVHHAVCHMLANYLKYKASNRSP